MRWTDERWVGFISTETVAWASMSPRARMLYALLLRAADRLGVISLGNDAEALSVLLRGESVDLPPLIQELTKRGFVSASGVDLHLCNFVDTKDLPRGNYVRLYTRDTPAWSVLSFEARGLFCLILRSADRAGLIPLGSQGTKALAALLRVPWDIFDPAFNELLTQGDGCIEVNDGRLLIPNFLEAQEAIQSDAARKRAERERDRARRGPRVDAAQMVLLPLPTPSTGPVAAPAPPPTESTQPSTIAADAPETSTIPGTSEEDTAPDQEDQGPAEVTLSHGLSRSVTACHAQSRPVTLSHSDLIRSDLIHTDPPPAPLGGGICGVEELHTEAHGADRAAGGAPGVEPPDLPGAPPPDDPALGQDLESRVGAMLREHGEIIAALATPAFIAQIATYGHKGFPGSHPAHETLLLEKLETALVKCEADVTSGANEIRSKPAYIITHVKKPDERSGMKPPPDPKADKAGKIFKRLWEARTRVAYGFPSNDRKLARQLWDYAEEHAITFQLRADGKEYPNEETIIEWIVRHYLADPTKMISDQSWPFALLISNMGRYGLPTAHKRPPSSTAARPSESVERSRPPPRVAEMLGAHDDTPVRRPAPGANRS